MDIFLNKLVQFYLNNTINLRRLSQRIISCCTHKMAIVSWPRTMWRHFTPCVCAAGSMLGRAFVCLSVCLSRRSTAATYGCRRVCWWAGDIDRQLRAPCSAAGAPALSRKCGQRHVNSRRRRLSTDLIPTNIACRWQQRNFHVVDGGGNKNTTKLGIIFSLWNDFQADVSSAPTSVYSIRCRIIALVWSAEADVQCIVEYSLTNGVDQSARCDNENICTVMRSHYPVGRQCDPRAIY